MRKIGIIGGIGAAAGARLFDMLIKECQKRGAKCDSDFPEVLLHSISALGTSERGVDDEDEILGQLIESVVMLNTCGVDVIAIACNTVHLHIDTLREFSNAHILNMPKLAACKAHGTLGVLCSRTSLRQGLYQTNIAPTEVQQDAIDAAIGRAISGHITEMDRLHITNIVSDFYKRGADDVILGCTELPLVYRGGAVIDPYDAVIEELLK